MDRIFVRVERSKGSPSLLPLLCSPPVAVPSIGYSRDYATHCLRTAFQYNRVRTNRWEENVL